MKPLKQNITDQLPIVKTSNQLQLPIIHLINRLKSAQFFMLLKYDSGKLRRVPATLRGNKAYAWHQSLRMEQIQEAVNESAKISGDYTNILFLTLTHSYNKNSLDNIRESWKVVPARLTKFQRKIKSKFPVLHYVSVLEAHEGGGCHAHVLLVLPEPIHCWKDSSGVLRTPENYRNTIQEIWEENVDVRGADSPEIAGYLTKELGKVNHVEDAIKHATKGEDTASDRKKIWAYYWADVLGIRLLRVSRSLPPAYELEGKETDLEDDERLDNTSNNSTDRVIAVLTVFRKQTNSWAWWNPWTGEIPRDSVEWQKITELFDNTTTSDLPLSKGF